MRYRMYSVASMMLVLAAASTLTGCGSGAAPPMEIPELLDVAESDRPAALAQRDCPVCGSLLGLKGTPMKVTAGKETIFLCSDNCKKLFEKVPDQYLNARSAEETE